MAETGLDQHLLGMRICGRTNFKKGVYYIASTHFFPSLLLLIFCFLQPF